MNTCTDQFEYKPMYVVQSKVPASDTTEAFENATRYKVGCTKRLKVRVKQGYSGSVMLAVQAISTSMSTSTDPDDAVAAGYVAISKSLLPVMIKAVVKPKEPTDFDLANEFRSREAIEGGSMSLGNLSDKTNITLSRYSHSTRYAIDLLDVTRTVVNVTDTFEIEKDSTVPRFDVVDDVGAYQYAGDKNLSTFPGLLFYDNVRLYRSPSHPGFRSWQGNVSQLLDARNLLDTVMNLTFRNTPGQGQGFHTGLTIDNRLALRYLISAWEPSSCEWIQHVTDEFFVVVQPQNTLNPVITTVVSAGDAVCGQDEQEIYPEDTQLDITVNVTYPEKDGDSNGWYYSHLEVTDNNCVHTQAGYVVPYDLHLSGHDGQTIQDPSEIKSAIDFTPQEAGIGAYLSNRCKQRSYANNLTRALSVVEGIKFHDFQDAHNTGDCDTKETCLKAALLTAR